MIHGPTTTEVELFAVGAGAEELLFIQIGIADTAQRT